MALADGVKPRNKTGKGRQRAAFFVIREKGRHCLPAGLTPDPLQLQLVQAAEARSG
jgi:hypothetical protein